VALCKDPSTGKIESIPGNSCPAGWATLSTGTIPVDQSEISTNRPQLPSQADTRPVVTSMKPPRPGLRPEPYAISNVYTERRNLNTLRVTDPQRYERVVNELRQTGLLGPRANSESSIDQAYNKLLQSAAGALESGQFVTPQEARNILAGIDQSSGDAGTGSGGRSGGRTAAYTGPVESIAVQAESDINATADTIAIELLGRGATKEEKDRIVKRIRKAEMAQPQVTRREGPGRQITQEGLTSQGREDILREVLSKRPEFEQFQLDTTVMDAMNRFVNQKKAVAGD
jgi:hypothetical protein